MQFPVRNKQGELVFLPAMIAKSEDTNIGYLAFTKQNIINQAFKFLGERYGWGVMIIMLETALVLLERYIKASVY